MDIFTFLCCSTLLKSKVLSSLVAKREVQLQLIKYGTNFAQVKVKFTTLFVNGNTQVTSNFV